LKGDKLFLLQEIRFSNSSKIQISPNLFKQYSSIMSHKQIRECHTKVEKILIQFHAFSHTVSFIPVWNNEKIFAN